MHSANSTPKYAAKRRENTEKFCTLHGDYPNCRKCVKRRCELDCWLPLNMPKRMPELFISPWMLVRYILPDLTSENRDTEAERDTRNGKLLTKLGIRDADQAGGLLGTNTRPTMNRPISVYRFPRQALTLCPQLCMGIQPGARFPARSADALPATLYGFHPGDIPKPAHWLLLPRASI
jgi:hypothetical protein